MNVRYRVELSHDEQQQLQALLSKGVHSARKLKRAQVLLAVHQGCHDQEIAANLALGLSTVYRTKRRFVEHGLQLALSESPRPGAQRKLNGKQEALLVASACSNPPEARVYKAFCEVTPKGRRSSKQYFSSLLGHDSNPKDRENDEDDRDHDEYEKQYLRDAGSPCRDACESQGAGNQGNDGENNGPLEHGVAS